MHLLVGLGNPGTRYRDTPHNAGFRVCDLFAERNHLGSETRKFKGLFRRGRVGTEDVGVLKPETYMNLSGESVAEAVRYLPLEAAGVVLVFDDMDLPSGRLRLRKTGGHGGHNGIRSVIQCLGTRDFARLRVGVGRPPEGRDPTSHLLSRVSEEERRHFQETVLLAVEALEMTVTNGFDAAMNGYNRRAAAGDEEGIES